MLAERGQKTVIGFDGKMTKSPLGDADALMNIKDDWNDYHIIARGNRIVLKVNGRVTAEVIDNDKAQREMSGALALQLHAGPPMTIQFKDIQMKRLKLHEAFEIAGPQENRINRRSPQPRLRLPRAQRGLPAPGKMPQRGCAGCSRNRLS